MEKNINYIFLAFKSVLNYSNNETLNTLKEWIKKHLNPKKINKKTLIRLFSTLNEYCKNIFNISIDKSVFIYDIQSIIIRFNHSKIY